MPIRDLSAKPRARVTGTRLLLQRYRCALLLQLGLDLLGFLLGKGLPDGARSTIDQVLGLFETQARDLSDHLDHLDLLVANTFEDDVELDLLFGGLAARRTGTTGYRQASS